jgi:hypothetical protein
MHLHKKMQPFAQSNSMAVLKLKLISHWSIGKKSYERCNSEKKNQQFAENNSMAVLKVN